MAMFVSYARQDRETVASLKADLERLGREVWIDEKLRGGQEWWDEILAAIRSCEVFVWTVSPTSVKSTACKAELGYAFALGRPVLPIMIKSVAIGLTPERIANSQIVDYTTRGADQAIKLAGDLQAVQSPPPLPETLPEPPPVPVSYLEPFAVRVSAPSQLSSSDQREVLDFLRPLATSMEDPEEGEAASKLLRQLRARPEVTFEVAMAIDGLLARPDPTPPPPERPPVAPVPPPPRPERAAPPPPPVVPPAAPEAGKEWSVGAFIALLAASLLVPLVGIVVGLANVAKRARQKQALALLGAGIALVGVLVGVAIAGGGDDDGGDFPPPTDAGSEDPFPFDYGDDAELDLLYEGCEAGVADDCESLYTDSPVDSEYEYFAETCGYRLDDPVDFDVDGCADQM